ncbi:MAG TPA: hypothetical protein VN736_30625 [Candidatus Limnocylindrales bacterium]|nr:hypothetical protein [Candidatus Limnocylindrales bacterium]
MNSNWESVRLAEVVHHVPRPVEVNPDATYREIGIRSHGKGVFHKEPVSGIGLGTKRVFHVAPGDFVLNIVFAWEGAVAVLGEAEKDMIASHRFPTFRCDERRLSSHFLVAYLTTPAGLDLLGRVSPGGAGRNRTLSRSAFLQQVVPLPPIDEQQRIVGIIDSVSKLIAEAKVLRAESNNMLRVTSLRFGRELFHGPEIKIGAIAEVTGGIQKGPHRTAALNPVRYLTVAHVQRNLIRTDDHRYFEVTPDEFERWMLIPGDVLVVEGNGSLDQIGRTALFRGEIDRCVHQNHLIRIRPERSAILPEYLNAYLNSADGQTQMQERSRTTSGLRILSVGRLKDITVPLPPIPKQQATINRLHVLESQTKALEEPHSQVSADLDAMLPAVLNRAFRGEV